MWVRYLFLAFFENEIRVWQNRNHEKPSDFLGIFLRISRSAFSSRGDSRKGDGGVNGSESGGPLVQLVGIVWGVGLRVKCLNQRERAPALKLPPWLMTALDARCPGHKNIMKPSREGGRPETPRFMADPGRSLRPFWRPFTTSRSTHFFLGLYKSQLSDFTPMCKV